MTVYLATADLGAITGANRLGVDTIAHAGTDDSQVDANIYHTRIDPEPDIDRWDTLLAAAGFTPTGDWQDHDGYWTCDVEFTNQPPADLPAATAAIQALAGMDPIHTTHRIPVLSPAVAGLLIAARDAAIYEVARGGWGPAAEVLGVSQPRINRSVTRHRARTGATA